MDIIYDEKNKVATICEFNPWGPYSSTGSQLYSWELDYDLLFGTQLKQKIHHLTPASHQSPLSLPNTYSGPIQPVYPDFRYLKKGMKVVDMFDLYFAKQLYRPSSAFRAQVAHVVAQCPCCPRSNNLPRPPTRLIYFSLPITEEEEMKLSQRGFCLGSDGDEKIQNLFSTNNHNNSAHHGDGFKLALIVRSDLKMKPGKVAVQCSHATLGAYQEVMEAKSPGSAEQEKTVWIRQWSREGQMKIALKVDTLLELEELEKQAIAAGQITYLVEDAGHTQVAVGAKTVLAIGPGPLTQIDALTKHLKLY